MECVLQLPWPHSIMGSHSQDTHCNSKLYLGLGWELRPGVGWGCRLRRWGKEFEGSGQVNRMAQNKGAKGEVRLCLSPPECQK